MRNLLLLTGVAALAIAMPAAAEKGGKGGGKGGGQAEKVHHGAGHGGHGAKPQKSAKSDHHAVHAGKPARAERHAGHGGGKPDKAGLRRARDEVKRQERIARRGTDDRFDDRRLRDGLRDGSRLASFGQACPPGLDRKRNGCLPPGQAKKLGLGARFQQAWFEDRQMPLGYRSFYQDNSDYYYRYDDGGYIYRVSSGSNLIDAIIPLMGGGFAVGQPLPAGYDVYNVPLQYREAWYDNDDDLYRYGDNAIYRVGAQSGVIESIVALLAGDLNVGQPLPAGYDAYNVPLDYRDEYADTDDYMYRYADGNIYQVDAKTQLVQAIVQMLI